MTINESIRLEPATDIESYEASIPSATLNTVWPPLKIEEHPIDEFPSIRVLVVGAGISGITAGVFLPAKVPNIDLVIYERQNDIVSVHYFESPIESVPRLENDLSQPASVFKKEK